jgi:hypothetical protein
MRHENRHPGAPSRRARPFDAGAQRVDGLRRNDSVKLSVDAASVKRSGDRVTLRYMLDYAKPQGDHIYQVRYRSVVTAGDPALQGTHDPPGQQRPV